MSFSQLCWFFWDPPREAFTIPYFDHPVMWYGVLFVTGFILGYFVLNPIFSRFIIVSGNSHDRVETPKQTAYFLIDRLCWFAVIGTLIGARLGVVFFYDWPYFKKHPLEILMIWNGGLASHGGVIGIMIALYFYLKHVQKWVPQLTYLRLLDFVAIPSALVAFFIRLGNFMNQEILGTPTNMPWGVIFGHPLDGSISSPRHPVQLYEAAAYLITFIILWLLWKKQPKDAKAGALVGWMFILIFGSRLILEFWKSNQEAVLQLPFLQMGQLLSIPFILLGAILVWRSKTY
jgi:phosphatidylglycerol---prolipoprotein diacylglyceryl transferase